MGCNYLPVPQSYINCLSNRWPCSSEVSRLWSSNNLILFQWASYQIRKIAGCACAGNAENVFPRRRLQRKNASYRSRHASRHVPWCMSESLTRRGGENVPGIPGACAPAILRIRQEAHDKNYMDDWCSVSGWLTVDQMQLFLVVVG